MKVAMIRNKSLILTKVFWKRLPKRIDKILISKTEKSSPGFKTRTDWLFFGGNEYDNFKFK